MTDTMDQARGALLALARGAFGAMLAYGVYLILRYNVGRLAGADGLPLTLALLAATAAIVAAAVVLGPRTLRLIDALAGRLDGLSFRRSLLLFLIGGLILRLAWIAIFPPTQISDSRAYLRLAGQLADTGSYGRPGALAYWPPGLPLSLTPWVTLFGVRDWVPAIQNMVLYGLTLAAAMLLARRFIGERAARLAGLMVAVSPTTLFLAGYASKELLVLAALTGAAWLYFDARAGAAGWRALGAGACFGVLMLAQPSTLLILAILPVADWLAGARIPDAARRIALVVAGTAVIVAPWTVRNWLVLDEVVLVSTNGGSNFYRANHDGATGGYFVPDDMPYRGLPEVERGKRLFADGQAWIAANPDKFAALALAKQELFLGDNGIGVYLSLKRDHGVEGPGYVLAKGAVNGGWLVFVALLFAAVWHARGRPSGPAAFAMIVWLYLFVVHSVFESGARHHVALSALTAVLFAGLLRATIDNRQREPL